MNNWQKLDWNQMTHDERMEWLHWQIHKLSESNQRLWKRVERLPQLQDDVTVLLRITESLARYHKSLEDEDARTET